MFELHLCETQQYPPLLLEHWLSSLQGKKGPTDFVLQEEKGKVKLLCTEDLSPHFFGSSSKKTSPVSKEGVFFVHQVKGPLLPIKRLSQFENNLDRERFCPTNQLIQELAKIPGSQVHFSFQPLTEKRRENLLKKVKKSWFDPSKTFDQWESRGWLDWTLRRWLGPLFRKLRLPDSNLKKVEEQVQDRHEREAPKVAVLDKLSRPLFQVQIRSSHSFKGFFQIFNLPYLGILDLKRRPDKVLLSNEELASLLSPPQMSTCARHLHSESTCYLPPPNPPPEVTVEDKKRHHLVLGKTGMGKSTLLLENIQRDISAGHCTVVMEPHGDLIEEVLEHLPPQRIKDLILIDPSAQEFPLALNPLELSPGISPIQKAGTLVDFFKAIHWESWGPRLEYILRNALLTLIQNPNSTLLDLPSLLTNPNHLLSKLSTLKDPELQRFWREEFLNLAPAMRQEHSAPILNKVGPLLLSPILRGVLGQPRSKLKLKECLIPGKIVLIRLSKGKLGNEGAQLLGMIFLSLIEEALFLRPSSENERPLLSLFVDEAHNFANQRLITLLSESRKFGLAFTLAHQYLEQLSPQLKSAILGNVGTLSFFRTSFEDAQELAPTLGIMEQDLTHLDPFECYCKLLSQGKLLPLFRRSVSKAPPGKQMDWTLLKRHWEQKLGRSAAFIEKKLKNKYNNKAPLIKNAEKNFTTLVHT